LTLLISAVFAGSCVGSAVVGGRGDGVGDRAETGLNWRTVKKYLSEPGITPSHALTRRRPRTHSIDPFAHVIDAWSRAELLLKGTVIHERW
jgi:hypothetical protein